MKRNLVVGLVLIPLALSAAKPDAVLAKAKKAEEKGTTEKAVVLYEKASSLGSMEATIWLWKYYGEPDHLNMVKTQNYLRKAALAGDIPSAYRLARYYEQGENMMTDYEQAAKYYKIAADGGNAEAQFNLGKLYAAGHGVKQDLNETVRLYTLAADQGHFDAQAQLAVMYKKGIGVEADAEKAAYWSQKVQEQLTQRR